MICTSSDIAWAAGLFEGEGTVYVSRLKDRAPQAQLSLSMNDEWPVWRFAEIVGGRLNGPLGPYEANYARWQCRVRKRPDLARVLFMFKDHLSPRRRKQLKRVIREVRKGQREFRAMQTPKVCGRCGCNRDEQTPGCKACYMRQYQRRQAQATRP